MIEIMNIKDIGNLDKERAIFRVTEAGDVGRHMVHVVRYAVEDGDDQLKNTIYRSYWFLDSEVSADDLVVLYTKRSSDVYKEKESTTGKKTHFFYWGVDKPIWDQKDVALVIGEFIGWSTKFIKHDADDLEPEN